MSGQARQLQVGKYLLYRDQVLGKGATGLVYRGIQKQSGKPCAVKAIDMKQVNNQVAQYLLEGEKKAASTIKSPYIVKTYDVIQQGSFCYIVMEECGGGTLQEHITNKGALSESEALDMFEKIITGYSAIVDNLFIHRDLKTSNIMLRQNGSPAIIDFGYCQMLMAKKPLIKYNVGSPSYMSPEAYRIHRYSEKSDVWALGIILYQMLIGTTPDEGLTSQQYFNQIQLKGIKFYSSKLGKTSEQLLQMALEIDVEKRATAHKLKYILDKYMIPTRKLQLLRTHSETVSTQSYAKVPKVNFVSPPEFPESSMSKSPLSKSPQNQLTLKKSQQLSFFSSSSYKNSPQQTPKGYKQAVKEDQSLTPASFFDLIRLSSPLKLNKESKSLKDPITQNSHRQSSSTHRASYQDSSLEKNLIKKHTGFGNQSSKDLFIHSPSPQKATFQKSFELTPKNENKVGYRSVCNFQTPKADSRVSFNKPPYLIDENRERNTHSFKVIPSSKAPATPNLSSSCKFITSKEPEITFNSHPIALGNSKGDKSFRKMGILQKAKSLHDSTKIVWTNKS